MNYKSRLNEIVDVLSKKEKILFITTSNRWSNEKERPKSSLLAENLKKLIGDKVKIIDAFSLNIVPCEGNVSSVKGNSCGVEGANLKDSEKNPSKCHRCWASINNPEDELWKISKELIDSDAVIFFGSVRWGQMNSIYQKLIERLTWLENRHSSLGEENILKKISAGLICVGHNWNVKNVVDLQKNVLEYFGFDVSENLFLGWQYTENSNDESLESYENAYEKFSSDFF